MGRTPNSQTIVASALERVKTTAGHVLHCPACGSDRIYTALNIAYAFDHLTQEFSLPSLFNLAAHGWHGCHICAHQWVSNQMLRTALPPQTATRPDSRVPGSQVIDLTQHKKKSD